MSYYEKKSSKLLNIGACESGMQREESIIDASEAPRHWLVSTMMMTATLGMTHY